MSLVYIENCRLPTEKAHGYQIMKMVEAFVRNGAEASLVVARRKNPLAGDPFSAYGLPPDAFPLAFLPVVDLIDASGRALWKRAAFAVERASFLVSLLARPGLWRGKTVYTRDPLVAGFAARFGGGPVFYEVHQTAFTHPGMGRWLAPVAGFVAVTEHLRADLARRFPEAATLAAPDAVDPARFNADEAKADARRALGLPDDAFVVCYGGALKTMGSGKGLGLLSGAVASLAGTIPNLRLVLVGGSREEFERAEGVRATDETSCVPRVPQETLARYYRAADLLAMPFPFHPHYAYAMSPLKLFEYLASGRPIVTSDLPAVREILDERSAFFFESGSMDGLARRVEEAWRDPAGAQKKGDAGRAIAKEHTWEKRAARIIAFMGARS